MTDAQLDLLVRDCWPRLVRTAYLLTGAQQAAQELVRDALTRRLDEARTEAELRDAVVREAFRHRALYAAGSAPFAEQGGSAEPMRAVLRQLPLDERAVLVLRFREGMDVDQVVDLLSAPSGIVGKREHRALRAVREAALVPQEGEPRPDELKGLLDAVAGSALPSQPHDVAALLDEGVRRSRRRLVVLGAVAAAGAAVAAAAWPF